MAGPTNPHATGTATVVHEGRQHVLDSGATFTFGRAPSCTLALDPSDRGISRLAGSVEHEAGTWWVHNRSGVRPLTVVDDLGIRTVVAPGRRFAALGPVTVVVEGSSRRHALDLTVSVDSQTEDRTAGTDADLGDVLPTSTADAVIINELDRLALVALFAGYLEPFPRYDPHPKTYADASAVLGWPRSTLVKRVEYLRTRLTNAGVPNLLGETALAHLAEWALTTRVLTREDLGLLRR